MGAPWEHEPLAHIVRSGHARDPEGIRFMAWIEKRSAKKGRAATWRVKWRDGGTRDGAQDGETCDDLALCTVWGEPK
jgi:hypothetical protein